LDEPSLFNRELMHYLLWYNAERPHRSIGNVAPLRYYVDNFTTPSQSNMPWTLTGY
jgi:transposase InsO family protein